ncbi:methyltransferase family protein [Patescibacteria group bacterium]
MVDIAWTIVVICWTFMVVTYSITKIKVHRCGGGLYNMKNSPLANHEKWLMRALIFIYVFFTFWLTLNLEIPFIENLADIRNPYFTKLGFTIFMIALVAYARARVAISSNWGWDKKPKADRSKLIKVDIYKTIRHPQYTAYFLAIFSTGIMLHKFGIVLFAILLIPLLYLKMKVEEEILVEVFPKEYLKYIKETRMFI